MFDETERACLAFGMLPASKMELLTKTLENKAVELFPYPEKIFTHAELEECECIGLRRHGRELADKERADFVTETEHEVCLAMYGVAPMVV